MPTEQDIKKAVAEAIAATRKAVDEEWRGIKAMQDEIIKSKDAEIERLTQALADAKASRPDRKRLLAYERYFMPGDSFNVTRQGELHRLCPELAAEFRAKHIRDIFGGK